MAISLSPCRFSEGGVEGELHTPTTMLTGEREKEMEEFQHSLSEVYIRFQFLSVDSLLHTVI